MNTTSVPIDLSFNITTSDHVSNWTFEDLQKLNNAKAEALMPAMLVIGLYIIVGIIGNSLVCYIMGFKLKMNTQNMFIIYLAVFDLLNCLICMPADIHDMRFYFYFPSEVGCKIVRMVMNFVSEASIFTLLIIAVDRFRKICKPMKRQINLRHTKWFLILVLFGALFCSWPALIIFGFRTIQTGIPGIPGHDCSYSSSLKGTMYPMVYTSVLFLLFVFLCVCLIVLYSCVLTAARRHRSYMSSNSNPNHFTYPSVRGYKYTKNNNSCSMTNTTDDTSAGLKESSESLSSKDLLNVNSNFISYPQSAHGSATTETCEHTKGSTAGIATISDKLDNPEMLSKDGYPEKNVNITDIGNSMDIDGCQKETQADMITLSITDIPKLEMPMHEKIETKTENSSSFASRKQSEISRITPTNSPDLSHKKKASTDMTNKLLKKESIASTVSKFKSFRQTLQGNIVKGNVSSSNETIDEESRKWKKSSRKISKLDHKTTIIAFLVTLVFILSYVPYLSLQISKQIVEGLDYDLQGAPLVLYNIFLRSYYINSVSNPIIYGLLNNRFRRQLRILLSKIYQACCRSTQRQ